ncbi:MAG: hypothetical protein K1W02_10500 [Muribaculaceae bacterium]
MTAEKIKEIIRCGEIVRPGALLPSLTAADIKLGNAFQRCQLIANLYAKTMDYRGRGSGTIMVLI